MKYHNYTENEILMKSQESVPMIFTTPKGKKTF